MKLPRRLLSGLLAAALVPLGAVTLAPASPAAADPAPAPAGAAGTPSTVSADALPTAQINGIVWDQVVVGDIVYVVGKFSSARPAGSPAGQNESPRGNAMAYNINTGEIVDWAPTTNGTINTIAASADGQTLYLGGEFTTLNNQTAWRVGAVRASDGQRSPLAASANGSVKALSVSPDGQTLYIGGAFTQINSSARQRVAALNLGSQQLTNFAPKIDNYYVRSIVEAVDGSAVAIGGAFESVEGSDNPGHGIAVFEKDGSLRKNNVSSVVRGAGAEASVMSVKADEQGLYAASYSRLGTFEGVMRLNWTTGDIDYMADCHGDSYDVLPAGDVVYAASHSHDCSNIGGFPDVSYHYHNAVAYTNAATGTVKENSAAGYKSYAGQNATTNLNFYPDFTPGKISGAIQATWTVEGNDKYVVYGGEFLAVNGTAQQGLVRFARRDIAPNKQGPMDKGGAFKVTGSSPRAGVVSLSFKANWDRDDKALTYNVYRDSMNGQPVTSQTVSAGFWERSDLSATDVVDPGTTHRYRVQVTDQWGASTVSDWVTVKAGEGQGLSKYGARILADGAAHYWSFDETDGDKAEDFVAQRNLTIRGKAYKRGSESVLGSGASLGLTSDSGNKSHAATRVASQAPTAFSMEAWVRTTSTSGGEIMGYGSSSTNQSWSRDRMVYMRNDGTLSFMLYPGKLTTITTPKSYNDGQWHHIVASMSPTTGAMLYVDGNLAAFDGSMTEGQSYSGYWRIGGDALGGVNGQPSNTNIQADIDEAAVYSTPLSARQIAEHYTAATGKQVQADDNGGKDGAGKDKKDKKDKAEEGSALLDDSFERSVNGGWGKAQAGGEWKTTWNAAAFSADGTSGRIAMAGPRSSASIISDPIKSTSTDAVVDFSLDAVPSGNGAFISYAARTTKAGQYQATVRIGSAGNPVITVSRVVKGRETSLGSYVLTQPYTAGQPLHLRMVVDGAESTNIQAKLWAGDSEPAEWGIEVVDNDKTLNEAGTVGLTTYMSGSAGPETVTLAVDKVTIKQR
nr:LamG domain-containing protein [uncultured Actinomyces sp.]